MTLVPEVYLLIRDGQTYLPKLLDPGTVTDIAWDYQEQGGLAQISATVAVPWEQAGIAPGDYMEAWVLGETVPRARGIVSTPENRLDLRESKTIIAFGRMADMDKVLDYKVIFHPSGSPQDLSYYATELLSDYQQRKAVGGAVAPTLDIDIQATGSNLESLTLGPGSVRSGFDQIYAQAAGNAVWGWDINPATGHDRCYLRPRVPTVGHQFFVGDRVKLITAPAELAPVTNGVYFRGGPAKYPNLMTNASFEQPANPGSDSGSLLVNGGFELPYSTNVGGDGNIQGWSVTPGTTRNTLDAGSSHNASPHTGDWYLHLDHTSESAYQEVAVAPGTPYLATAFVRAENGARLPTGLLTITGRDSSDNVTETPAGAVLALNPASVIWSGGAASAVVGSDALQTSVVFTNPATVKARITLSCTATSGPGYALCVDDVTFGPVGALGQYGWSTHLEVPGDSRNAFDWILWACKAAAWDGAYGVRASVRADMSHIPVIAPAGGDNSGAGQFHFRPAPQQSLACGCFVRMAPGLNSGPGTARACYREWAGDGHIIQQIFSSWSTGNIPNDGQWHLVENLVTAHGDVASATNQVEFGSSGVYDVDGFFARDQAAVVAAAQDPQSANYLRGTDFERYVTAEQVCTGGSAVDVAASASCATWGRREAALTNDQVVDWTADARAYLQAYFQRAAVLLQRPRAELIATYDAVLPGDGTRVQVSGTGKDLDPQWCSHASYSWKKGGLDVSLELTSERPTWAKMLKAATASGGGAGGSVGAPSGGGQTGAGTPAPAAITVADGTTTLSGTTAITFSGATVTQDAAAGTADVAITGSSDHKVAVDAGDASPGYLAAKLAAGANITITDSGGVLQIASTAGGTSTGDHKVALNASDGSPNYLDSKIAAGANVTFAEAGGILTISAAGGSGTGTPPALEDLSDVSITGRSNGQVLTYSASQSAWKNVTPPFGGIDAHYNATANATGGSTLLVVNTQSGAVSASPPGANGIYRQYVLINASTGTVTLTPQAGTVAVAQTTGGSGTQTTGDAFVNVASYASGGTQNPSSVTLGPGKTATMWSDPGLSTWYYTIA